MIVPALVIYLIERLGMMPKNFWLTTLLQMSLFFCHLYVGMPLGVGAFPSTGTITKKEMELESDEVKNAFKNYRDHNGQPLEYAAFNKGL